MELSGKTCFITGVGSGIGRALALQLSSKCAKLILCDIDAESLSEVVNITQDRTASIVSFQLDVGDKSQYLKISEEIISNHGPVDVVVNNAGVALMNYSIEETTIEDFEWIVGINMWGVIYGTKFFLSHLKKRPEAYIVNISSIFGIIGFPNNGAYCATKHAVKGFTKTLEIELMDTNVHTLCVHPGGIKTNIAANAKNDSISKDIREDLALNFEKIAPNTAEYAANKIVYAIGKNKHRLLIGSDAWRTDLIARYFPNRIEKIIKSKVESNSGLV